MDFHKRKDLLKGEVWAECQSQTCWNAIDCSAVYGNVHCALLRASDGGRERRSQWLGIKMTSSFLHNKKKAQRVGTLLPHWLTRGRALDAVYDFGQMSCWSSWRQRSWWCWWRCRASRRSSISPRTLLHGEGRSGAGGVEELCEETKITEELVRFFFFF